MPTRTAYIAARAALGPEETNRRLLGPSGVSHYLVDTGFATGDLLDLAGMAAASGRATREIVRLEGLAEEVAASGVDAGGFAAAFVERLGARIEAGAVGTKSIVAYRHGFDVDPSRPAPDEVAKAVSGWFAGRDQRASPTPRCSASRSGRGSTPASRCRSTSGSATRTCISRGRTRCC